MKIKVLLTSAMTIAICLCVIAGSTFALFTKNETVRMQITAGALEVDAMIQLDTLWYKSAGDTDFIQESPTDEDYIATLKNGGKIELVQLSDGQLYNVQALGLTPGDGFQFNVKVTNDGEFAVENTIKLASVFDSNAPKDNEGKYTVKDLLPALNVVVEKLVVDKETGATSWVEIGDAKTAEGHKYIETVTEGEDEEILRITVTMAEDTVVLAGGATVSVNDFQGAKSYLTLTVSTVQCNNPEATTNS